MQSHVTSHTVLWLGVIIAALLVGALGGFLTHLNHTYPSRERYYRKATHRLAMKFAKLLLEPDASKAERREEADSMCAELLREQSPVTAYHTLLEHYQLTLALRQHQDTGELYFASSRN